MAEENKIPVVIRTQVYLTDPEYFCNKSWTLSYNLNTKSWISYHSYLPNFYIGENNFFYSGLNGCCTTDEFQAFAGVLNPVIPTTTSTTTYIPSPTTTTTTTLIDCDLEGEVRLTNCNLVGTGLITVPPTTTTTICSRPSNLTEFLFIEGYTLGTGPEVIFTASQVDACAAVPSIQYIISPANTDGSTLTTFSGFANTTSETLQLGNTVYYESGRDCTFVPDGWYFAYSPTPLTYLYQISGGVIINITVCDSMTTTTTTTIIVPNCFSFTISKTTVGVVAVTYTDCSGNPQSRNVGNVEGGPSTQTFCARSGSVTTPPEVTLINNGSC